MSLEMLVLAAAITAGWFLYLMAVFRPLELVSPAKPDQPFIRPEWATDLLFFLGQFLVWNVLVADALGQLAPWLDTRTPGRLREAIRAQPWVLQALEVVIASDLCIYWAHRLQHRIDFLWRFHSVHHSAEHLDWLAAHREHPLDTLYSLAVLSIPALVIGFPIETLGLLYAFRGLWAVFLHSNVRLTVGPLRMLIGAPELHHWHHDRDRDAGNYANLSPLMDILFGTYRCPDGEPERFGIEPAARRGYFGHLVLPLLPAAWQQAMEGTRGASPIPRHDRE